MSTTGYVWDAGYLGYSPSSVIPERPGRAEVLAPTEMCRDLPGLKLVPVDVALGQPWLGRVHEADYIDLVRTAHAQGRTSLDRSREVLVREDVYPVSVLSVSGALSLVSAVARGEVDNGFGAIRPPGHHAGVNNARGFCVFNNAAICARFAQQALGLSQVLLVDWDVHPADGTSSIFYEDPTVHVVSVHQAGIFSDNVGLTSQRGRGEGEGTTYNLPLDPGCGEEQYVAELFPLLEHAAERCRPDVIIVSCGFDAHAGDPIGAMNLQDATYLRFTRKLRELAKHYARGRIVSLLEGGYELSLLRRCTREHLAGLME